MVKLHIDLAETTVVILVLGNVSKHVIPVHVIAYATQPGCQIIRIMYEPATCPCGERSQAAPRIETEQIFISLKCLHVGSIDSTIIAPSLLRHTVGRKRVQLLSSF